MDGGHRGLRSVRRHVIGGCADRGFTLLEIVSVIVIAGILGVTAMAAFKRSTYELAAAADEARALIGHAQKVAVAARRAVRITRTGSTLAFDICTATVGPADLCPTAGSAWTALAMPRGSASWTGAGVSLSGFTTLHFDSVGRPVDTTGTTVAAQTLALATAEQSVTLTIEAESGHVD